MMHYPKNPPPREFVGSVTRQAFQAVKASRKEGPLGRPRWSGWDKLLAALFIFVAATVSVQTVRNCTLKANADFIISMEKKVSYIPCTLEDLYEPFAVLNNLDPFARKDSYGFANRVDLLNGDFRGIRGGKLGSDRGWRFMARGIRQGDSMEKVRKILGEADQVLTPGKSEIYRFSGDGREYQLFLDYSQQKLDGIKLIHQTLPSS